MTRARSSRKWSPSDIRPPSPMGSRGRPRNSSMTPPTDTAVLAPGSGEPGGRCLRLGQCLGLASASAARFRASIWRCSGVLASSSSSSIRPLVSALKMRRARPLPRASSGSFLRAEEEHDDADDDQQLGAPSPAMRGTTSPWVMSVMLRRRPEASVATSPTRARSDVVERQGRRCGPGDLVAQLGRLHDGDRRAPAAAPAGPATGVADPQASPASRPSPSSSTESTG